MWKIIYRIFFVLVFLAILGLIIAFARGYRLDLTKQSLTPTGIISISAFPKASKVYVNGQLKGVTDINLTLPPDSYNIEVKKDGYTNWNKTVKLKGEIVLTEDVLLYPLNPSLSPLTNLGVVKAIPLPQSSQVILFSDNGDDIKDGVYLFDSTNSPLSFFPPLKLIVLKTTLTVAMGTIDFKDTLVDSSPDNKEAIFTFKTAQGLSSSYLFSLDGINTSLFDIAASRDTLLEAWANQKTQADNKILEAYPEEFAKVATDSFHIIQFSPDETKVLYQPIRSLSLVQAITPPLIATNQTEETRNLLTNNIYVYDKKEDKNYQVPISNFKVQNSNLITWYTDSKHLLINEGKTITAMDYDGTNKQTIYSGPFDSSFFKVSTDGRIMVLTNLNPAANQLPDLYAVGIR